MLKKQSVIRYLSLLGIMGMLTMGTGCAELKRLRTENQQLNDRLIALQKENADLSVMASRYENELKRLEDSRRALQAKLEGTGATTKVKDGLLSIMLPGSVLFDPGQAKLRPQSKETLNKIAKIIKSDIPNQVVRIEGHTDNDPIKKQKDKYKTNWELSAARATNVLHYLVDECRVSPTRVYIAGFAQYQPVADNKTKKGKAKNRRVEFVIAPKGRK